MQEQGDVDHAVELYQQVLQIKAVTLGKQSPGYAFTLNNLAGAVYARRSYLRLLVVQKRA